MKKIIIALTLLASIFSFGRTTLAEMLSNENMEELIILDESIEELIRNTETMMAGLETAEQRSGDTFEVIRERVCNATEVVSGYLRNIRGWVRELKNKGIKNTELKNKKLDSLDKRLYVVVKKYCSDISE